MNTTIPWYQSAIIRQQIVAFLVAGLGLLGIATDLDIEGTVAAILAGIGALIPVYTIITRVFKPSPNITQAAVTKEKDLVAEGTIPKQGGFVRPLMLALLLAVSIPAVLYLPGCATLGIPVAKTFNERLAAGYVSTISVRTSATTLLNGSVITSGDATNLQKQADVAREGLDVARGLPTLEAETKLEATLLILRAAQGYLCGKNPNDPNCVR